MALQEEVPTFTESHSERRHRNEASTRFENDEKKGAGPREAPFERKGLSSEDHLTLANVSEDSEPPPSLVSSHEVTLRGVVTKSETSATAASSTRDSLPVRARQKRQKRVDSTPLRGQPFSEGSSRAQDESNPFERTAPRRTKFPVWLSQDESPCG